MPPPSCPDCTFRSSMGRFRDKLVSADQDDPPKKSRTSGASKFSGSKQVLSQPVKKKNKQPSIEFIPRDSETLETRIYEPSWITKAWRFLTEGVIEPKGNSVEEAYLYYFRSFSIYILHTILVFWVIYGTFDLENNYHSIIMSDLITRSNFESNFILKSLNFNRIKASQQIWDFIRGVMLKILYPIETYNATNSILQENVLIGVAQLRQVRVKKDTCETGGLFEDLYKSCYGYFNENDDAEDKEPFGLNSSTSWRYQINIEKKIRGRLNVFTGSGYAFNFSKDYSWTVDRLKELEDNQWIRLGTRAVFLDFATFCPNTNTFLVVKLTFEIMPMGSVIPTSNFYAIKLLTSLNDAKSFARLGLEIVLLIYTIALNFVLFLNLKRMGMRKIFTFNCLIDVAIILSTYATLGVHIALWYYTYDRLQSLVNMTHASEHPTFGIFLRIYEMYLSTAAVLLLCIVLKFIRYAIFFNETAKLMVCTLKKIQGELICLTIMNLCILFGYACVGSTIYGSALPHMATPLRSLVSLIYLYARAFKLAVHDNVFGQLSPPNNIVLACISPFAMYYINCISHQTYVALLVHGWQLAVRDCSKEALRIKAFELTLTRIVMFLEKLRLYKWANKLQEYYITQMNEDDYDPVREIMRRYGWTNLEIRLLLKKYGIRKGDDLTIEELFEVYQDFWMRNALYFEVTSHARIVDDFEYIQRTMKFTESTIADLKHNIERLADTFLDNQTKPRTIVPSDNDIRRGSTRKSILGRMWK